MSDTIASVPGCELRSRMAMGNLPTGACGTLQGCKTCPFSGQAGHPAYPPCPCVRLEIFTPYDCIPVQRFPEVGEMRNGLWPEGEGLRNAVRWISERGDHSARTIEEAARRFDLSQVEEEFLLRYFLAPHSSTTGEDTRH